MIIEFDWQTQKLTREQKDELENEIRLKISKNLENLLKEKIHRLVVALYDDNPDHYVTGIAFSVDGGEKTEVINTLEINSGFSIRCKKAHWFQPRGQAASVDEPADRRKGERRKSSRKKSNRRS